MARAEGIDERKLKEAAMTGQYVKEQPISMMKEFSDNLLGTHLQSKTPPAGGTCPLSKGAGEEACAAGSVTEGGVEAGGCGCSSPAGK
jgi:hypothetical protein